MSTTRYDCSNPNDQQAIANNHTISQTTFESYLNNFWNTPTPNQAPTVISWAQMESTTSNVACTDMRWKLEMDENNTNNNEITLSLVPTYQHETIKNYSIALFKGMKLIHSDIVEFHFYKARKSDNSADIIFMGVDSSNQPAVYGDASDLHP